MNALKQTYEEGNIVLDTSRPPFDGKPVLVKFTEGICEAWWAPWRPTPTFEDPNDGDGWLWVCMDDTFTKELDDAQGWWPLPSDSGATKEQG